LWRAPLIDSVRPGLEKAVRPVILAPGFMTATAAFAADTVSTDVVEYLTAQGYDVWLFDYRGSPPWRPGYAARVHHRRHRRLRLAGDHRLRVQHRRHAERPGDRALRWVIELPDGLAARVDAGAASESAGDLPEDSLRHLFAADGPSGEKGRAVDRDGRDVYLPNVANLRGVPLTFIAGELNQLFTPETSRPPLHRHPSAAVAAVGWAALLDAASSRRPEAATEARRSRPLNLEMQPQRQARARQRWRPLE
jgi:hypothetical protein